MASGIKIQVDELEAELSYEGWINFKSKVMGAMLKGTVSWEEGNAMRSLIDHHLSKYAKQYREYKMDTKKDNYGKVLL
jgi:hypothetical protein